jgi:hypothetical protein
MAQQKAERRAVSMYPDDWQIVEDVNTALKLRNVSQSLRLIVNEYTRLKSSYEPSKDNNEQS